MNVQGYWSPKWAPVVDAFAANFVDDGEKGAGVALYHRGEIVLNIWAGERDNKLAGIANQSWDDNTLVNIFSVGKGLVALCVLQLVEQGKLDLDAPIAHYWPEFSVLDKQDITVGQVLSHRSGLSAFHSLLKDEDIYDWPAMINIIAAEKPWWQPGDEQGYSPFIYGWIMGELVRRASGYDSFNAYFQAHVAKPLGVKAYFGVPDEYLNSIADVSPIKRPINNQIGNSDADTFALVKLIRNNPRGVTNRAFSNPVSLMVSSNSQAWRQAQIPAANAHANAQALATIFGVLANGGAGLLNEKTLPLCWQEQTFAEDKVLGLPLRFSNGFMLSQHQRSDCRYGRGARAFGHPGAGGCVGFADPDYQLGFGYVTQNMGQSLLIDERAIRLIDAVYAVLN